MSADIKLKKPLIFDWDKGNKDKNVSKHKVQNTETEEVFFNNPALLKDISHSESEERYFAFGVTDKKRHLIISFTLRGEKQERIRPIMARNQNKKERLYEQKHRKEVKKGK